MYILFKLKADVQLFITSNIGFKLPTIIANIIMIAITQTNIENSGFVLFKIKPIDTEIKANPTIENNIFVSSI